MTAFKDQIAAIRSHTASYASDPEFHAEWRADPAINLRAQRNARFGTLVGSVTQTAGWRSLMLAVLVAWLRAFSSLTLRPKTCRDRCERCAHWLCSKARTH